MPASRCAPTGKVQPALPALLISDVDTDAMAQFMSLVGKSFFPTLGEVAKAGAFRIAGQR